MDYTAHLDGALSRLHEEGRYRTFIDIERETELGGPIHSKGVFILASFVGARYSRNIPLSLTASRNIAVSNNGGAQAGVLESATGDITLTANSAGLATGAFHGIDIAGATVLSAGNISLTATGGDTAGSHGVAVRNNGVDGLVEAP